LSRMLESAVADILISSVNEIIETQIPTRPVGLTRLARP